MSFLITSIGVLLTILGPSATAAVDESHQRLFSIKRSLNTNEVIYEAVISADCFAEKNPVRAHWIMNTQGGVREELTAIEKQLAYGVVVKKASCDEVTFSLKALPGRSISLRRGSGPVAAITLVNDEEAVLESVFIQHESGGLIPSISFVDIAGVSVSQSVAVSEHYIP